MWERADIYKMLADVHGWSAQRIAKECSPERVRGTERELTAAEVRRFIACARKYPATGSPTRDA